MPTPSSDSPANHNHLPNGHSSGPPFLPSDTRGLADLCAHINTRLEEFIGEDTADKRVQSVQEQTRTALAVIAEAFGRYKVSQLSISYNGGKDCLVLLILYLAALHRYYATIKDTDKNVLNTIQSVYIQSPNPFNEVESFVASSSVTYSLTLATYPSPMKAAFSHYLKDHSSVKAIFVGTRRTDPHGANLTHFDRTDSGWPDFMRIHPVIDWHYVDIWTFIRHLRIPYCPLYDKGYTSLGGTTDTHPNPALQVSTNPGNTPDPADATFRPAYELVEDEQERLGRDR